VSIRLFTENKQFRCRKGVGYGHTIYTICPFIIIERGNTANMCAVDLSKAFDKLNHHALFIKQMKIKRPVYYYKTVMRSGSNVPHLSIAVTSSRIFISMSLTWPVLWSVLIAVI